VVKAWTSEELLEYLEPILSKWSDKSRQEFKDANVPGRFFLRAGSGDVPPNKGFDVMTTAWVPRLELEECAREILGKYIGFEKSRFPFRNRYTPADGTSD
jgi:hypothetical protein